MLHEKSVRNRLPSSRGSGVGRWNSPSPTIQNFALTRSPTVKNEIVFLGDTVNTDECGDRRIEGNSGHIYGVPGALDEPLPR